MPFFTGLIPSLEATLIMAKHLDTGLEGEHLAADHLSKLGFQIVACNWRFGHLEIDLIAARQDVIHFFEVKTRRTAQYGYPELAVTKQKLRRLYAAAAEYCRRNPVWKKRQYNIISIVLTPNKAPEFFILEDIS